MIIAVAAMPSFVMYKFIWEKRKSCRTTIVNNKNKIIMKTKKLVILHL